MKLKTLSVQSLALVCLLGLSSLRANATQMPEWLHHAVFYQVYPSSFMDSDGNGIGDLKGIISKLDYIKSLGVTTIWLNPICCSEFQDGGYDVTDFYKVDPRFGTNDDLVNLLHQAHKRGLKVLMDLVAGHTSDKHPWFLESALPTSELQYSNYYIWTNKVSEKEAKAQEAVKAAEKAEDAETTFFRFTTYVEANAPRAKYYEKNCFIFQPALNYGYANPDPTHPWEQAVTAPGPQAVRRELRNIMQFWYDKGVDGFRVDMAASLVKNDPDKKETIKLWNEIREWQNKNYPDCILLAEWGNPQEAIQAGFNVDFMFHFGIPGYPSMLFEPGTPYGRRNKHEHCYFDKSGAGVIKDFIENYTDSYTKTKGEGYIVLPSCNHDFQRPNIGSRNTIDQLKVTMTFFMTMPGMPLLYYGDEIGMKYKDLPSKEGSGDRAGARTPMQWTSGINAGFSTAQPKDLYLPVDTENGKLTVDTQENDPASMLNFTKSLIALRQGSKALGNDGEWQLISDVNKPYPMIYKRYAGNEVYVIALNPGAKSVVAKIPALRRKPQLVIGEKKNGNYKSGKVNDVIRMKGVTALVYKMN